MVTILMKMVLGQVSLYMYLKHPWLYPEILSRSLQILDHLPSSGKKLEVLSGNYYKYVAILYVYIYNAYKYILFI